MRGSVRIDREHEEHEHAEILTALRPRKYEYTLISDPDLGGSDTNIM